MLRPQTYGRAVRNERNFTGLNALKSMSGAESDRGAAAPLSPARTTGLRSPRLESTDVTGMSKRCRLAGVSAGKTRKTPEAELAHAIGDIYCICARHIMA